MKEQRLLVILGLLLVTMCFAWLQIEHSRKVLALEAELQRIAGERNALVVKVHELSKRLQTAGVRREFATVAQPIPTQEPAAQIPSAPPAEAPRARQDDVDVDSAVATVDHLIALSAEERKALATLVRERGDDQLESAAKEVLGEERYKNYRAAQLDFRRRIRADVTEREVFTLTRKLGLSSEQESRLGALVLESRDTFLPFTLDDDPMFSSLSRAERTRRKVEAELQRQQFLSDKLKDVFSEDQYNQYLEIQANSAANQSHQSYVDVAATPTVTAE
jgi:hypothetical protein